MKKREWWGKMPKCKSKTKFLPATFAWLLLLGTTALFFYFPCVKWYILEKHWYAVPIFQGVITLFVLINFSMATFMDPGVSKNLSFLSNPEFLRIQ